MAKVKVVSDVPAAEPTVQPDDPIGADDTDLVFDPEPLRAAVRQVFRVQLTGDDESPGCSRDQVSHRYQLAAFCLKQGLRLPPGAVGFILNRSSPWVCWAWSRMAARETTWTFQQEIRARTAELLALTRGVF